MGRRGRGGAGRATTRGGATGAPAAGPVVAPGDADTGAGTAVFTTGAGGAGGRGGAMGLTGPESRAAVTVVRTGPAGAAGGATGVVTDGGV